VSVAASGPGACPTCLITSASEQIFPGNSPPGPDAVSVALSSGPSPVVVNNASFGNNTNGSTFPGVTVLSKVATSSGITGSAPLISFESDVRQTNNVIPEPATLSLMGISLLGLGLMRRRVRN
jgi:hypothetical protein